MQASVGSARHAHDVRQHRGAAMLVCVGRIQQWTTVMSTNPYEYCANSYQQPTSRILPPVRLTLPPFETIFARQLVPSVPC